MEQNIKNKLLLEELVLTRKRLEEEIQLIREELRNMAKLQEKVVKLVNQQELIQSMIDRITSSEEASQLFKAIGKPKRPIKAIFELFRENPDKKYSPPDLRDELEYLKKQNLLLSDANNLLFVVHSCLRGLLKSGFIMKVVENDSVFYQYKRRPSEIKKGNNEESKLP